MGKYIKYIVSIHILPRMTLLVCSNFSLLSTKKATLPNGWLFLCTLPGAMMLIYDYITPFGFVIVVFSVFV